MIRKEEENPLHAMLQLREWLNSLAHEPRLRQEKMSMAVRRLF